MIQLCRITELQKEWDMDNELTDREKEILRLYGKEALLRSQSFQEKNMDIEDIPPLEASNESETINEKLENNNFLPPKKIRGWLLVFIIGQILASALSILVVLAQYAIMTDQEIITSQDSIGYILYAVGSIFIVYILVKRIKRAVLLTQVILMIQMVISAFIMTGSSKVSGAYFVIWVLYFLKSKRVKETYLANPSSEQEDSISN